MDALGSPDSFIFEGFRFDRAAGGLFRTSGSGVAEPVALSSRALDVLALLVQRHGQLVSKDEIFAAVWPGTVVGEGNLTVQISALRRVLDRHRTQGSCIQTIPSRGYRFIASVTRAGLPVLRPELPLPDARKPAPTPRADAERRQITAMSCELIGISGGADGVGLEDLRDVVAAFQRCVSETVDRHHGFVVSRLGNAALVLIWMPRRTRIRRRARGPRGARIVCGGQDSETRFRPADAVPGRHRDRHGDHQ